MLQIHHIAAAPYGGVGGSCCGGGTPRLRCLHDARGGEIVRAACLREAALVFAEVNEARSIPNKLLRRIGPTLPDNVICFIASWGGRCTQGASIHGSGNKWRMFVPELFTVL